MKLFPFDPSGGLSYHFLARREKERRWRSYREHLGFWIHDQPWSTRSFVVIGPNGGYTLPTKFFRKLKDLVVFEPDCLSRWIFLKQHRDAKNHNGSGEDFSGLQWHRRDFFAVLEKCGWDRGRFLREFGLSDDSAFVFTNVLGQLEFLRRDYAEVLKRLGGFLQGAEWMSVHDRLSSSLAFSTSEPLHAQARVADSRALAERFFVPSSQARVAEVEEHDVDALWSAGTPKGSWAYFAWELRPGWNHVVEGVYSPPRG